MSITFQNTWTGKTDLYNMLVSNILICYNQNTTYSDWKNALLEDWKNGI